MGVLEPLRLWRSVKNLSVKETLVQLALGTLSDNDKCILANHSVSKKVLEVLSRDKNNFIRSIVADNFDAPRKALKELSVDKNWDVRVRVAQHANASLEILKILSEDKDWIIRYRSLRNINARKKS